MKIDNIVIRPVVMEDAEHIFQVMSEARVQAYDSFIPDEKRSVFRRAQQLTPERRDIWKEKLLAKLQNPSWIQLVILDGDEIVGYIAAMKQDAVLYISQFHISPNSQGKGYGKKLYEEMVRESNTKSVQLHVARDNHVARKFYEKVGFVEEKDEPKSYYGAPLILMSKY